MSTVENVPLSQLCFGTRSLKDAFKLVFYCVAFWSKSGYSICCSLTHVGAESQNMEIQIITNETKSDYSLQVCICYASVANGYSAQGVR